MNLQFYDNVKSVKYSDNNNGLCDGVHTNIHKYLKDLAQNWSEILYVK